MTPKDAWNAPTQPPHACADCGQLTLPMGAVLGLDGVVRCWFCAHPRQGRGR